MRVLEDPKVWQDQEKAQSLGRERSLLQNSLDIFSELSKNFADTKEMLELIASENDEASFLVLQKDVETLEGKVAALEFQRMFNGEMDANNAYMDIQSGSGGTEAQDWAEMMLRMYLRFGDRHGFQTEILECSAGDVAGIKSATVKFTGSYAYGWLRTETGVHRLVRK